MTNTFFDTKVGRETVTALETAQKTPTPFMADSGTGAPVIVGDVNQVDVEQDYEVQFLYPSYYAVQGEHTTNERGEKLVTRRYEQVAVTPRKARKMRYATSTIILSFTKMNRETGLPEIMTLSDVAEISSRLSDELVDAMESVLQHTLGISDHDMEYVTDESLLKVVPQIIQHNSGFFQ